MSPYSPAINQVESSAMFDLAGKVAVIAGGYGALGQKISRVLASAGAIVAVGGRNGEKAKSLADDMSDSGRTATGFSFDATRVAETRGAIDRLVQEFGRIDLLVNCLGIQREQSILDVTEDAFDEVYATNLKASMFLGQTVAHHQIAGKRGGKQVHLLSIRSQLGMRGRGYSAYCATKAAQAAVVKQHAAELAVHGITVNGVAPAVVHTHKNEKTVADPAAYSRVVADIPLGRIARPYDVAAAALFFCAPASDFVTGQTLYLDGGLSCCR